LRWSYNISLGVCRWFLNDLKEEFHRTGRFDDANAKLDEILKIVLMKFYDNKEGVKFLDIDNLEKTSLDIYGDKDQIIKVLQSRFSQIAEYQIFKNQDGTNVFGANPHLYMQPMDREFAKKIVGIVQSFPIGSSDSETTARFDLLNEAFGHFVRVNFRNHKEDAQYLTPWEVTNAMVNIALHDILSDEVSRGHLFSTSKDAFLILDPTCGVGSFLTCASQKIGNILMSLTIPDVKKVMNLRNRFSYVGQDKVDRMVRMSKINCLFSGLNPANITQGNSILGKSFIDNFSGAVDLILTNPPFGAEFPLHELIDEDNKYEILPSLAEMLGDKWVNSELVILDRSLRLLKPGGRLLIIVPDSVVSASGIYEVYRKLFPRKYVLKLVIDLPSVTFAQAGTRTRCSILYIQKPYKEGKAGQDGVFMGIANEVGYEVRERLGTPVKYYTGKNDLIDLVNTYKGLSSLTGTKVIRAEPSAVVHQFDSLINGKWNANFYNSKRIQAIKKLENADSSHFQIKTLKDVAELCSEKRSKLYVSDNIKIVSVLHLKEDSTIKLDEVASYKPRTPGIQCFPGDILFSKINPRIIRVAVVPEVKWNIACSSEFAILRPFNPQYTYLLKIILTSKVVQEQIQALTSGTSSSHNRIRDTELMNIQLPWPNSNTEMEEKLLRIGRDVEAEEQRVYLANKNIRELLTEFDSLIRI
jgi:type I restriction-modification system DNA methylase subunit